MNTALCLTWCHDKSVTISREGGYCSARGKYVCVKFSSGAVAAFTCYFADYEVLITFASLTASQKPGNGELRVGKQKTTF